MSDQPKTEIVYTPDGMTEIPAWEFLFGIRDDQPDQDWDEVAQFRYLRWPADRNHMRIDDAHIMRYANSEGPYPI